MKHTYATGPWYGIVANGGVALLPALSSPHLLHEVFEALKEGKGLGALLQALTSAFGTNLADLPPFAVVAFVGDDALIAVRGPLSVFIDGDAEQGAFSVSGARVTTWSESISSSPRSVVISSLPNGAAEFLLPIDGGVVLCSAVECLLSGVSSAAPSTAMVAKSEPRLVAVEVPQMEVAAEPLNVRAVKPDVSAKPLVPVPVPVPAPVPELPSNETETNEETLDISAETATSFYDTIGRGYDEMLSGETVVSSVESAAVRPSEEPEAELEHDRSAESAAPATIRHEPVLPVVIPTPVSPRAATPASLPPTQMIVGVPRFGSAAAPVSQQLPTVADAYVEVGGGVDELDGDHDGETVSVDQLRAIRAAAARAGERSAVSPAAVFSAGTLLVSTGPVIDLDRDVVIGRKPSAGRVSAGSMPHLVTVPSPDQDISRSHLAIRREGIHVFAVDLDTTNGTRLNRVGKAPERLHPQEPTMLAHGDVLDLGDGVTVSFEAPK